MLHPGYRVCTLPVKNVFRIWQFSRHEICNMTFDLTVWPWPLSGVTYLCSVCTHCSKICEILSHLKQGFKLEKGKLHFAHSLLRGDICVNCFQNWARSGGHNSSCDLRPPAMALRGWLKSSLWVVSFWWTHFQNWSRGLEDMEQTHILYM